MLSPSPNHGTQRLPNDIDGWFRLSIDNTKIVGQRCVVQPEELRSEDQITAWHCAGTANTRWAMANAMVETSS